MTEAIVIKALEMCLSHLAIAVRKASTPEGLADAQSAYNGVRAMLDERKEPNQ